MYTRIDDRENGRQNSILTTSQRKLLKSGVKSGITTERKRIRERVREGLGDFRILAEHLEERDRKQIFEMSPEMEHNQELQIDVQAAIEFLYIGMGGEAGFRKPLERAVSRGEVDLGNANLAFEIEPTFHTDRVPKSRQAHQIVDLVEAQAWDKLHAIDLFSFMKWVLSTGMVDFDEIRRRIDENEQAAEMQREKIRSDALADLAYRELEEQKDS